MQIHRRDFGQNNPPKSSYLDLEVKKNEFVVFRQ